VKEKPDKAVENPVSFKDKEIRLSVPMLCLSGVAW